MNFCLYTYLAKAFCSNVSFERIFSTYHKAKIQKYINSICLIKKTQTFQTNKQKNTHTKILIQSQIYRPKKCKLPREKTQRKNSQSKVYHGKFLLI